MSTVNTRVVPFPVTNEQFLQAVFLLRWGEALVAYFLGDPAKSADWRVYPAAGVLPVMTPAMNNYWDVSLPQAGASTRQGVDFGAIYAIVLDDYEVKVAPDRACAILGPPSYIIETSPKNFHAGWFTEPLSDRAWVHGMLRGLYEALGRKGDNLVKPTTLVRLPVGTNGKAGLGAAGFRVKLVHWQPDRRIGRLDWPEIEKRIGGVTAVDPRISLDTAMPDPAEIEADLVLRVFRDRGMVLDHGRTMPFGWGFEVECPWRAEHTDPRSAASYVPVKERFKCHHGHCENRTAADVRAWADACIREDSGGLESLASQEFDDVDPGPGSDPKFASASSALASYPGTEDGMCQAYADRHESQLRFDHARGTWFFWANGSWQQDRVRHALRLAAALVREYRGSLQDATPGLLRVLGKVAFAEAVERLAKTRKQLATDGLSWDQDPWLIGAPGCEINLRTGTTSPPNPAHGITKQLLVAPDDIPTPLWDRFLWDSTGGDPEVIAFLQAWSGYCLTGDISEEKFVFIYGPGGNGKGTFLFTISAILNDYGARTPADMFMVRKHDAHTEEVARLAGVRSITATEIEEGRTFNVVRLKDFTGRDGKLMGRFMRRNTFEFTPQFKVTFVGNNQPRLTNVDDAMRRRVILVPFTQTPTTVDTGLKDQLVAEYPGILRWMIEGENRRRSMGGLSAMLPSTATQATREYLDDQDTLRTWANEQCVFNPGDQMGVTRALEEYRLWCHSRGEHTAIGINEFGRKFVETFPTCRKRHTMRGNVLEGVSFCP